MVGLNSAAPRVADFELGGLTAQDAAFDHSAQVDENACGFLGVGDFNQTCCRADKAGIADLTAAFCIERRLVDHDLYVRASGCIANLRAVTHQGQHLALGGFGVIAKEFGHALVLRKLEPDIGVSRLARTDPSRARFLALLVHRGLEALHINAAPLFAQRILRQI